MICKKSGNDGISIILNEAERINDVDCLLDALFLNGFAIEDSDLCVAGVDVLIDGKWYYVSQSIVDELNEESFITIYAG